MPHATTFPAYADAFANIVLTRTAAGVLEMRLHSHGDSFRYSAAARTQLLDAFQRIGADRANRVVILTGTGDDWCAAFDRSAEVSPDPSLTLAERWDVQFREGRRLLQAILDIDAPMIAAVNGPVLIHSEYLLTCDIILASDTAAFQDKPHLDNGVSPSDGVHVLWPYVLGPVRGHYFLMTQQRLDAAQALATGVCNEVLPREALMTRAHALAAKLAEQPDHSLRYARVALTQRLKKLVTDELALGLSLESLSALAKA
ncbi:enoyl-CoA hydratase/isomerase family protein [Sphingomonas sp. AR_OL41]|uniref:enoyl-CoA hydratase/isomerase family protein n=1 Tax=Sphingomonas sp. AR_OL41 TaxID=3042729 RepID=UPI00248061F9|nr:enoyl-CoA hydratase/isomerase family protein [Sphingomonas sp. AR_OL41]MDH7973223.1 enoyl-CoA hydratase/isomerase family protein [Sphingomonas sp. AR_OL41]